ncbi:MAG: cobalt ECF transporter T component CbiQ [Candidatus Omnitrophica bacterium]|nr:cobalt ECF transporter T component CbiQ [Candidatus Omnitrophota bacterium]
MNNIGKNYFDIGYMDTLAQGDSWLHQLDPRAKLITTLLFIIAVVSFGKYTIWAFIPFFLYPVFLIAAGGLPGGYLFKKVLLVSPFAILLGIFNPLIDREIILHIGTIGISGGWISFLSVLIRFVLTVIGALLLVALTGFNSVCEALRKLGVPKPFVIQLMFFYRYLFVLTDEAQRMERARALRSFHSGFMKYRTFVSVIGYLLLRTLDRAERIYYAMCCRGFDGQIHRLTSLKSRSRDFSFISVWLILFIVFRIYNIPEALGAWVMGCLG